jgi:hypothetical protein
MNQGTTIHFPSFLVSTGDSPWVELIQIWKFTGWIFFDLFSNDHNYLEKPAKTWQKIW